MFSTPYLLGDMFNLPSHSGYGPYLVVYPGQSSSEERNPREWRKALDLQGFAPEDVKIEMKDNNKVLVNAVREEGDENHGFDRKEARRVVEIPEGVTQESLKVAKTQQGRMYILGQRKQDEKAVSEQERGDNENSGVISNLWSSLFNWPSSDDKSNIIEDENGLKKFQVTYDLTGYTPEEIKVKQNGNQISVTAEHKEEGDGRYVHRQFNRTHHLPRGAVTDQVKTTLNKSGQLMVCAPVTDVKVEEGERNLPIEQMDNE